MRIFAHRGLCRAHTENSIEAFSEAISKGFDIEADLRSHKKEIILSHGPASSHRQNPAKLRELFAMLKGDTLAALHIKEGSGAEIISALTGFISKKPGKRPYKNFFFFDLTLEAAEHLKKLFPESEVGISICENDFKGRRPNTIYTYDEAAKSPYWDIVWADEWHTGLYTEEFISRCKQDKKKIYAVSPELHRNTHPFSQNPARVWEKLISLNIDGICTDYPEKLGSLFEKLKKGGQRI